MMGMKPFFRKWLSDATAKKPPTIAYPADRRGMKHIEKQRMQLKDQRCNRGCVTLFLARFSCSIEHLQVSSVDGVEAAAQDENDRTKRFRSEKLASLGKIIHEHAFLIHNVPSNAKNRPSQRTSGGRRAAPSKRCRRASQSEG